MNRWSIARMLRPAFATLASIAMATSCLAVQEDNERTGKQPDAWKQMQVLVGNWGGTGDGKAGESRVMIHATKVLDDNYIFIVSRAATDLKGPGVAGKMHEDWSILSYDKARKKPVIRQFNIEGYVNRFVLESMSKDGKRLVFVTEDVENGPPGLRARITYRFVSDDEYHEEFDLAPAGKEFETCAKNHLKRDD